MENLKSFKLAKDHFSSTWAAERRQIIVDLKNIKDEVQTQAKIHSIGSITYSSFGLAGGVLSIAGIAMAPVTLGTSLALTIAGIATGVTSGVAGLTHGVVKIGIIKSKCNEAKTNLENHDTTSKEMKSLVAALKVEIDEFEVELKGATELEIPQKLDGIKHTGGAVVLAKRISDLVVNSKALELYKIAGNSDDIARLLSLSSELGDLVPSAVKDVSKGAAKLSTEALSVFAALGIIIDLGSLIYNAVDLSKMGKGKLCNEAQKLEKVIKTLEKEYEVLCKCFD